MSVWIKINCVFHGPLKFKLKSVDRKNVIHCHKMDKMPRVLKMFYGFSLLVAVFVNIYGNKSTCFNHRGGHVLSLMSKIF